MLTINWISITNIFPQSKMSSSNSNENGEQQTGSIWQVNKDMLDEMQQKTQPKIPSSCCIYKAPRNLRVVNRRFYQPQIVSIGPYHHGLQRVQTIEEHKWRFLSHLLNRIKDVTLEDLLKAVQLLESRIRECYSETGTIHFDHDKLIKIMVLDGCFIIELFRKVEGLVPLEAGDTLVTKIQIVTVLQDMIRLENQIPFFVLDCLFNLTREEKEPTLATLTLKFFNGILVRPDYVIAKHQHLQGKHILDLLRSSFIPPEQSSAHTIRQKRECCTYMMCMYEDTSSHPTRLIHCVSKLLKAGIRLKPVQEDSFLSIKFNRGVIQMPAITMGDFMCEFLLNCIAYEQCHNDLSSHMTTYAVLLDCLINTYRDVEYLSEQNVMENYLGSDDEAARFINNLAKHVAADISKFYLTNLFDEVNKYYDITWHMQWESFKNTYFSTPWSLISAIAALVLLVLTVLSTVYTILGYNKT